MSQDESLLVGLILSASWRGGQRQNLIFQHTILLRQSESHPAQFRGEIIGSPIGSGGFGTVYKVLGTLVPQEDGSVICKPSSRVVKHQKHKSSNGKWEIENEADLARQTACLHAKAPIHIGNESFSVMRYIQGIELFNFIVNIKKYSRLYSAERILQLALNMLYSVKDQLHDRGLVSRDIKPENMIVNEDTNEIVNVDLGLAKFATIDDWSASVGTVGYCAPEALAQTGTSVKTDVFSLGISIGLLLGADSMPTDTHHAIWRSANEVKFRGIFSNVSCLSSLDRQELLIMLKGMTRVNPVARISIRQAISIVETVILRRKLIHMNHELHEGMLQAYRCAEKLRDKLDPLYMAHKRGSLGQSNLMDVLIERLKNRLESALKGFPDRPAAVSLFVGTLRLPLLYVTNKTVLRQKMNGCIATYQQQRKMMKVYRDGIYQFMNASRSEKLIISEELRQEISEMLFIIDARFSKYAPRIDNLPVHIKKLTKTNTAMNGFLSRVEEVVAVSNLIKKTSFLSQLSVFTAPALSSDTIYSQQPPPNLLKNI